jgi:hypothetical protein
MDAVALVDPAPQAYPAVQLPEQAAVTRAVVAPNFPAGHWVHADAPAREYWPAGQMEVVAEVDPAGHACPAEQLPVHDAEVSPAEDPYCPAEHSPVQSAVVMPVDEPYLPAAHWVQNAAPPREYCPAMHRAAVGEVDPAGQAYPAVQFPEQAAVARPGEDP